MPMVATATIGLLDIAVAPFNTRPFPASLAGEAGARPDHSIRRSCCGVRFFGRLRRFPFIIFLRQCQYFLVVDAKNMQDEPINGDP
jgi:hypothetical protein